MGSLFIVGISKLVLVVLLLLLEFGLEWFELAEETEGVDEDEADEDDDDEEDDGDANSSGLAGVI